MSRAFPKIILPAFAGALFVVLWYGLHFYISEDRRFFLPTPGAILSAFGEYRSTLARATIVTFQGALLGFGLAVVVGFGLALLLSISPIVRASLYPYLMALQLTPIPILAPICIIWFGPGLNSIVLLTFAVSFFPLVVNTTQGLVSVDRNLVELFRLYRATQTQELFLLRVPAALPYFFIGLRIAAILAPVAAVVADMSAGTSANDGGGLGFHAVIFSSQAKYPALFATAAVTCVLGFVFNAVIVSLGWWSLRHWHDSYDRKDV